MKTGMPIFAGMLVFCAAGCGATRTVEPESQLPGTQPPLGAEQSGEATFYLATGGGACSYDPGPEPLLVAAMNAAQYDHGRSCGTCVEVQGPMGSSVVVRITDLCPECDYGDLDLSETAFDRIADRADGRVPISWTPVACSVQGPIALRFKEGSSQWWLAVQVRNSRLPVRLIELQTDGSQFVALAQQPYNYAVDDSGAGPGPFTFRITAGNDQQLIETGVALQPGAVVQGTQQFAVP